MAKLGYGRNSVADRRYYHFVVVKGRNLSLGAFWKQIDGIGEVERPKVAIPLTAARFTLEHRKLSSDRGYARGGAAQELSANGNGRPPFFYDLFAAKVAHGSENSYFAFGFPFAALALEAIDHLQSTGFLRHAEFQGVHLGNLLSERNRPLQQCDGLRSKVVGVQFVVTDDKSLTAVRLGGDDPFHAQIYEAFLKRKFEQGLWVPEHCVLACERDTEAGRGETLRSLGGVLRSRLHMDKSGNFKFYMHAGCANVTLMPYAVIQIRTVACLKQVFGNPLRRIEEDEAS